MEGEKNIYIENFCKALVEKNEPNLKPEAKDKVAEDLYFLYENLLGRNMVKALPEKMQAEFVSRYDKGQCRMDFQEIQRIFSQHVPNPDEIMKQTLKELAALYFKNR